MRYQVQTIAERILEGKGSIAFDEAEGLIALEAWPEILELAAWALRIREKFTGQQADTCSLINAKSGRCPEDCAFCSQSGRADTDIPTYPLVDPEQIVQRAKEAKAFGAQRFCIVTATGSVSDKDLPVYCEAIRRLKEEVGIVPECSLGFLTEEQLLRLKAAGMVRYNHNLETAQSHFPKICTTHTYQQRREIIQMLKRHGVEACCGGILGLGESRRQRLELAFALAELEVECAPINILNSRAGTPLESSAPPAPQEIIKTIAIFRFILPRTQIKLAGGREAALREFQTMALLAGANALIIGGYLTTQGREPYEDLQMLEEAGFTVS